MLERGGKKKKKEKRKGGDRRRRGEILYFNNDLSRKRECNFRAFACTTEYGFNTTQTHAKNVTFA